MKRNNKIKNAMAMRSFEVEETLTEEEQTLEILSSNSDQDNSINHLAKKKPPKISITVRLDDNMRKQLRQVAFNLEVDVSSVVRYCVDHGLKNLKELQID